MKKPFVQTVDEITAEIKRLKDEYNWAKDIDENPIRLVLCNPPPAVIMQENQEKIEELQAQLKEMLEKNKES
jgi:hypothetical protein